MNDDLGDRMKGYEALTEVRLMPILPTFARIDGRAFSSFTRGMARPFDAGMSHCMISTLEDLMRETNACMGYTQSDEFTLCWNAPDRRSQIWFDGRHSKMVSQLAALTTLYFYRHVSSAMPQYTERLPSFDARVWQVPTQAEGANVFLWREWDAVKNSITMAAREYYSDKELHMKNGSQKQEMLFQKGVNWNDYPYFFKRGTYVQRRKVLRAFTCEEVESLPAKHEARKNPDLKVERSDFLRIEMPIFSKVVNREAVIFEGAEPSEEVNPNRQPS